LADLPVVARVALCGFVVLNLAFHLAAQVNVWVQVGGGEPPGARQVLERYHGSRTGTRLHAVLDLSREDGLAMWPYLVPGAPRRDDPVLVERREAILAWVEAGFPVAGWASVEEVFTGESTCGRCHAPGGIMQDLPLTSREEVIAVAGPDEGMDEKTLLVSAHNHLFGFSILALVLGLAMAWTPVATPLRIALVVGATAGAALDVGSWFLTKYVGAPWQHGVIAGGAAFGVATATMALLVLDEAALRGAALGRWLRRRRSEPVDA
jgi:hypothetical protein